MLLHELADAVVNLVPEFVAGDRTQLLPRDLDGQIHRALVAHVHDYRVWSSAAREEVRNRFNRLLRGGEADARWTRADERAIEHVEAFEREREVSAALVVGHGVNLAHDYRVHVAQDGAAALRREQDAERFWRGDQNMRRAFEHLLALVAERVTGADGSTNFGHQQPFFAGQRGDFTQRTFQVLLDIVAQGLQRGDIEYLCAIGKAAAQ